MKIKQIAIYHEGPYYRIEEDKRVTFAYGDKSAKRFISKAKNRVELIETKGVCYSSGLVKAVNDYNKSIVG